jgi:hypothetical protein
MLVCVLSHAILLSLNYCDKSEIRVVAMGVLPSKVLSRKVKFYQTFRKTKKSLDQLLAKGVKYRQWI